ncbi:RNA polymerase sigma-54 factor [Fusobacterium sp. DD29]|nr:RNA polymerase sigma-54 factor [Fusobacterium sp. DD45]MBR8710711.1 RNA polymerase sigma-54 factor [Fusobacterium sp. DD28]MBR8749314.1 RNA polymerase sigma-54 factor [Fusobacterium sp. DD29]MBR8751295.1 RNA polymerase sigma-54 factor [Fusobacterium sp. DD26]MBR8761588.1 RNA polymerase sigma-54 factor [Fusobacterium sp. DD25]MBR8767593.1 RNA polymerase sigma-54 factor [Fusobacterium sp. DD43]MBR8771643.1 RNA polymerase sigma-54 factor [Fusobacterium sp. DD40]MBR8775869.1 RNA polymerase si
MQTSINILQMSMTDLKKYIENETKSNPAVEVVYKSGNLKNRDEEESNPLDILSDEETLTDVLEEQLRYLSLDDITKEVCIFIINNLDHRGYLGLPKEEIIKFFDISSIQLKNAFNIIYTLDPKGVGAENLKDCLKIQLRDKNYEDSTIYKIIDYYLEDLALQKFDSIGEELGIAGEKVKSYLYDIQKLNPIPARGYYTGSNSNFVIPDATIYTENGKLQFSINEDLMPKVYVNTSYKADTPQGKRYLERISYISKSIERRRDTLNRLLENLILKQEDFFFKGKKFLKTLTMKEVAHDLELHESTISRAVNDKYLDTPQGIISMKSLFILDANVNRIKDKIEEIIENENRKYPFSDTQIAQLLEKAGFTIARRTVAKYREEIGYDSSRKRKK